jgi:hypothetical protein
MTTPDQAREEELAAKNASHTILQKVERVKAELLRRWHILTAAVQPHLHRLNELRVERKAQRRKKARDWREWSRFRLWRKTRPFWGSILMILAGLLILAGPAALLQLAFLPGSMLWAGLLVGALLFTMGLIQLLMPSYALITGAIGIILSLVSLIVAIGGFGVGMLLGIIGSALGIAWRPVTGPARPRFSPRSRPLLRR